MFLKREFEKKKLSLRRLKCVLCSYMRAVWVIFVAHFINVKGYC